MRAVAPSNSMRSTTTKGVSCRLIASRTSGGTASLSVLGSLRESCWATNAAAPGSGFSRIGHTTGSGSTYLAHGLRPGVTYRFRVQAVDWSANRSRVSGAVSVRAAN